MIKYYNSKSTYILLLIVSLIFVAIGILTLIVIDGLAGFFITLFFSFSIFFSIKQILDKRPRLVLDQEGITDRILNVGKILWTDIVSVDLKSMGTNKFISLYMYKEINEKYLSKIPNLKRKLIKLNTSLGFTTLNINLSGVKGSTDEILDQMKYYMELKKTGVYRGDR